jgi:hypothetical protein
VDGSNLLHCIPGPMTCTPAARTQPPHPRRWLAT